MEAQKPEHTTGGEERRSARPPSVFVCMRLCLQSANRARMCMCVYMRACVFASSAPPSISNYTKAMVNSVCAHRSCLHLLFHTDHVNQIIQLPRQLQMDQ